MGINKAYGMRSKTSMQTKTLDTEHTVRVKQFDETQQRVSLIEKEMADIAAEVDILEKCGRHNLSDGDLERLLSLRDTMKDLNIQRDTILKHVDEVKYFTQTSSILYRYYDILENGKSTIGFQDGVHNTPSSTMSAPPLKSPSTQISSNQQRDSILKWFQAPHTADSPLPASHSHEEAPVKDRVRATPEGTGKQNNNRPNIDRASLLDKYMACIDASHIRQTAQQHQPHAEDANLCPHCGSCNRTAMVQDGYIYCNACFTVEYILVDHDKPSYKDPPKEITYFAYKRINHFNEWLNTVQGKETTLIPDEMFDKILLELKKLRITNLSELTNAKMKDILKKLRPEGGSRYYEHIPHIITKLNGLPTPHFPPELEERLRHMFCQIQVPFLRHACALTPGRKNFLSYSYCLHKMVQLLEKDQYMASFPLLKSREKLHQQDLIWKKICEDLGWQYYRSI